MIQKYPVGIQDFNKLRSQNYVYVDKTSFVWQMADWGGYYFLSRPRRFGKSLLVSTLDYLFQGKKDIFEGLYIYDKWDWSKTNPVIKISFSNIGHKDKGLKDAINDALSAIAEKNGITLKEKYNSGKFRELIEALDTKLGKVVVLIDEYDKPIIDYLGIDTPQAIENREILKAFYSILKDADPHLKMVFITGVSKFARVSVFSDLNNLQDLTIDNRFGAVCGITQQELETNFVEEINLFGYKRIKSWYNGYTWDLRSSIYNPFSLVNFFTKSQFKNYWFESATPTFLINLAKEQELYNFENIKVSPLQLGAYDLDKIQLVPLMFQTGYLTIKAFNEEADIYTLDYPNREVRQSYMEVLLNNYVQNELQTGKVLAYNLHQILENNELEKLQSFLNSIFKSIPYEIWQKENEHFYHAIIHLTFRLLGIYVESQVQTSDGRIDALVQTENYVYAFEFKLNDSAEKALQQIKDKNYLQPYFHQGKRNAARKCIGIGINFSVEQKKVQEIIWEEIEA
jgi:Predicted AAA-ATPase/PD-(D/E)XK nuclease superfamily